jgi:hypothetical protein
LFPQNNVATTIRRNCYFGQIVFHTVDTLWLLDMPTSRAINYH